MNSRTFGALAVVAVLLAALAILGQRGSDTASIAGDTAGQAFLPALGAALGDIERIEITGAGRERLVSLERAGDGWTVAEQDGYPAAAAEVNALLIALAEAKIVEEKTADSGFHARLGVEAIDAAEAAGLELALVAGSQRFDFVLGDSYGSTARYARLADSARSVLIDRDPDVTRDPADWLAPGILAIAAGRTQQVTIEHADGERLVVRKDETAQANFDVEAVPEGRELQYAGIADVTGSVLQGLELEGVSRQPETPGERLASVEFRTFDGLEIVAEATAAEDGEPWISFAARIDEERASVVAGAGADTDTDSDAVADADADADVDAAAAVSAEAAEINARLAGWRFRIPAYQYSQLTRRMEDLLRAPPAAE